MLKTEDLKWICQGDEALSYKERYAELTAMHTNKALTVRGYYAMAEKFGKKVFYTLYDQFSNIIATIGYMDERKEWTVSLSKGSEASYNEMLAINRILEAITAMGGTDKGWTYPV